MVEEVRENEFIETVFDVMSRLDAQLFCNECIKLKWLFSAVGLRQKLIEKANIH